MGLPTHSDDVSEKAVLKAILLTAATINFPDYFLSLGLLPIHQYFTIASFMLSTFTKYNNRVQTILWEPLKNSFRRPLEMPSLADRLKRPIQIPFMRRIVSEADGGG